MKYSRWDEVILKVADSFGYRDRVTAHVKVMIIGVDYETADDDAQYLCYVPPYERIPWGFKTFIIDKYHAKHFNIEQKFIGDKGCFITARTPTFKHIPARPGEKCDKCGNWFDDASRCYGAFTCHSCRNNPYR